MTKEGVLSELTELKARMETLQELAAKMEDDEKNKKPKETGAPKASRWDERPPGHQQ